MPRGVKKQISDEEKKKGRREQKKIYMGGARKTLDLSEEEKKKIKLEWKKMYMRESRAKLDAAALEERRRKDREKYQHKKKNGLLKTIKDFPRKQQQEMRKMWRERLKKRREYKQIRTETLEENIYIVCVKEENVDKTQEKVDSLIW